MDYSIIDFVPYCQISNEEYKAIRHVGGLCFENKTLRLDFCEVFYRPVWEGFFLQLKLYHIGVEADLYVRGEEVQRLLGIDVKHLSEDYLSFLVTKHFSKHGIIFNKLHTKFNMSNLPVLLKTIFTTDDAQQAELFIDVKTLVIKTEFLSQKQNQLSGDLSLTTIEVPLKTYLSPGEIKGLNTDDVVLVYPE